MSEVEPGGFRRLLPVWIMIGTILGVVLAGYLVFPRTDDARAALLQSIGTKNQGLLLNPVAELSDIEIRAWDDTPITWHSDRPVWTILVATDGVCSNYCEELLASSRLVHARLDKNAHRVERFLLTESTSEIQAAALAEEFPKLKILASNSEMQQQLQANNSAILLSDSEVDADALVYLIDPRGVAMMVYRPEQESTALLEDIKHLLKTLP